MLRAKDEAVKRAFLDKVTSLERDAVARGMDIRGTNPTPDNIRGGLSTIEEKALGNIQKIGRKCLVDGVLDKGEVPTGPGLWFMDSSSAAAEMVTLCAASGYAVHFFPTGQGNVIGNPILPVIKLTANPRTQRTMSEHIDVDVSGITRKEINMDQAGDRLLEMMFRTANGRLTAAEALHLGIVTRVVALETLNAVAIDVARRSCKLPPALVRDLKLLDTLSLSLLLM